jgi:hypothetical protein
VLYCVSGSGAECIYISIDIKRRELSDLSVGILTYVKILLSMYRAIGGCTVVMYGNRGLRVGAEGGGNIRRCRACHTH